MNPRGLLLLSGDVHYAEISKNTIFGVRNNNNNKVAVGSLVEVTTSGMTHSCHTAFLVGPLCSIILQLFNTHRYNSTSYYTGKNFALLKSSTNVNINNQSSSSSSSSRSSENKNLTAHICGLGPSEYSCDIMKYEFSNAKLVPDDYIDVSSIEINITSFPTIYYTNLSAFALLSLPRTSLIAIITITVTTIILLFLLKYRS
jgi:hypothetical protein